MSRLHIRRATENDWPEISRISREAGYEDYINRVGKRYLDDGVVIICNSDVTCGFLKIELLPDGSSWLSGIRVDPQHRKIGVAASLTNSALLYSSMAGCSIVRMLIRYENTASINLARKGGFKEKLHLYFYDGVLDGTGKTRSIDRNDELVNIGWKFATCNKIRDGEVKTDGSSDIFFFNDMEESTQLIRSDKRVPIIGNGVTCIPERLKHLYEGYAGMEGFEQAFVFERKISGKL